MTLTTVVLLVLLLYVVQLFLQEISRYRFDVWKIMGTRDSIPEASVVAARLERAKNNMLESLPLFLGLAMLVLTKDGSANVTVKGATLFLVARVAYVPIYAAGIPVLRSIAWLTGMAGLLWMALTLI